MTTDPTTDQGHTASLTAPEVDSIRVGLSSYLATFNETAMMRRVERIVAARVAAAHAESDKVHRDLTRRLGFGDGITEPMAPNDVIVAWFDEQGRDADEWRESQRWRDDCYAAGHPEDEDCWEHDPTLIAVAAARAEALQPVRELADDADAVNGGWVTAAALRAVVSREPGEGDTVWECNDEDGDTE